MNHLVMKFLVALGLPPPPIESPQSMCERAVRVYLTTLDGEGRWCGQERLQQAAEKALRLLRDGSQGLEIGAPGSATTRLLYRQGTFALKFGAGNSVRLREWEARISAIFKREGLPFEPQFQPLGC